MIVAKNFRIRTTKTTAIAECDLIGPGFPERLGFEVSLDHLLALDIDEPNWAAMTLLYPAMLMGQDLAIEADLSALLLHNMQNDLMALIRNYEPKAQQIRIHAGQSSRLGTALGRDVMTGFSAGVDSYATLAIFSDKNLHPDMQLTALGTFHVGALGPTGNHPQLLEDALALIRPIAEENGLRLYGVSSDLDPIFAAAKAFGPTGFPKTVGFRNVAAAMALQKGVRTYMTAGSRAYNTASYGPQMSTEPLDPVLQPLFHTESLRVIPVAAGMIRRQKTLMLADRMDARKYLNPCVVRMDQRPKTGYLNCSQCWKCCATLLDLESLGRLEAFGQVFDLDFYRANRDKLLRDLFNKAVHEWGSDVSVNYRPIIESGVQLPQPNSRLVYKARKFSMRVFNKAQRIATAVVNRILPQRWTQR